MRRILLAFRAFFLVLFNADAARRVETALSGSAGPATEVPPAPARPEAAPAPPKAAPKAAKKPARSEALTLLATLQREARLVDFVQEPIDGYSDAQIGAAVRDVHRECRQVLERLFALQPVVDDEEGAQVEVPEGYDPGRWHLTGQLSGEPPFQGRLVHHGWQATHCELPTWSGSEDSLRVLAPAEVELK